MEHAKQRGTRRSGAEDSPASYDPKDSVGKRQAGLERVFPVVAVALLCVCGVLLCSQVFHNAREKRELAELMKMAQEIRDQLSARERLLEEPAEADVESAGAATAGKATAAAAASGGAAALGASTGQAEAVGKIATVREVAKRVAGPDRMLIVVTVSKSYLDFLENWLASVSKFGKAHKVLFIAEDDEAFAYMHKKWPQQTVIVSLDELNLGVPATDKDTLETANSTYGSGHYNALVDRRPEYFKILIDLKVTFLYNDVDIVWLEDPFNYFKGGYDMWVQEDAIYLDLDRFKATGYGKPIRNTEHAICTCFMFVRPTIGSRRLIHKWSRQLRSRILKYGQGVLNQPAFNKALSQTSDSDINMAVLPIVNFPSGYIYYKCSGLKSCRKNKQERGKFWKLVRGKVVTPVIVHNNWVEGHDTKIQRFKDSGMWYVK